MKKALLLLFAIVFSLVLVACGGSEEETSNSDSENEEATEDVENEASNEEPESTEESEESSEESETMTSEENENKEAGIGDTVTNEAGESTLVSRTDDVGTFESGPIKLTIEKANGVAMNVKPDYVEMMGGEEIEYIQVDMTVENTSEDHISFYASQAVMTTNTGEQLESDMLFSEHIDGEYMGAVTKSGSSFYILENSTAEEVEAIKLFFDAPVNENFESLGEDIEIEIPLNR